MRWLPLACCVALIWALSAGTALAAETEYVDCNANPSGADGSQAHPWTTLADASAQPLVLGSHLLFKRGTTCTGTLAPTGPGGVADDPSVIGAYGDGPLPRVIGNGDDAVRLENTSYAVIQDLDISNPGDGSATKRGVHLLATGQTVTGVSVRFSTIHDVGGDLDKDFGGSGGIQVDSGGPGVGRFDGLSIDSNTIENVSRSGIFVVGVSSGTRPPASQPWPEASTNVRITNNRLAHLAGDGIVPLGTDGAFVSGNVVSDGNRAGRPLTDPQGPICDAGIWTFDANRTTIEHNEVYGMNFNGCDGTGFDIDYDQDGTVVRDNYSHDNGGGFMLLCTDTQQRAAEVSFNLSVDDAFMLNSSPCGEPAGSYSRIRIYNNTVVAPDPGLAVLGHSNTNLYGPASLTFFNNIVAATGPSSGFQCAPACDHNLFSGLPPAGTDYVTGDPRFVDPGRRGTPDTPKGFALRAGSPALGAGRAIPAGVTNDYFGNLIDPARAPNIGFDQGHPAGVELSALRLRPRSFRAEQGRGPSFARRGGAKLSFRLDSSARVVFKVFRVRRASAKRGSKVGRFTLPGQPGANRRRFTGRVHHRPLRAGRYVLRAVAWSGQVASSERTVHFRILRPR